MQSITCQMCGATLFETGDDDYSTEPVWCHLEDTGCDDPVPVYGNDDDA